MRLGPFLRLGRPVDRLWTTLAGSMKYFLPMSFFQLGDFDFFRYLSGCFGATFLGVAITALAGFVNGVSCFIGHLSTVSGLYFARQISQVWYLMTPNNPCPPGL